MAQYLIIVHLGFHLYQVSKKSVTLPRNYPKASLPSLVQRGVRSCMEARNVQGFLNSQEITWSVENCNLAIIFNDQQEPSQQLDALYCLLCLCTTQHFGSCLDPWLAATCLAWILHSSHVILVSLFRGFNRTPGIPGTPPPSPPPSMSLIPCKGKWRAGERREEQEKRQFRGGELWDLICMSHFHVPTFTYIPC